MLTPEQIEGERMAYKAWAGFAFYDACWKAWLARAEIAGGDSLMASLAKWGISLTVDPTMPYGTVEMRQHGRVVGVIEGIGPALEGAKPHDDE